MARKNSVLADSDQIKDQVFSELQSLIEESEKLLNNSAALVGDEAETLRAQQGAAGGGRHPGLYRRASMADRGDFRRPWPGGRPAAGPTQLTKTWAALAAWCESGGQRLRDAAVEAQLLVG